MINFFDDVLRSLEAFAAGCTASTTPSVRSLSTTRSTEACRFLHACCVDRTNNRLQETEVLIRPCRLMATRKGYLDVFTPQVRDVGPLQGADISAHWRVVLHLYQWITLNETLALIADGMYFQPC